MLRLYTTLFFWTIKKNEYVIFREFLTEKDNALAEQQKIIEQLQEKLKR